MWFLAIGGCAGFAGWFWIDSGRLNADDAIAARLHMSEATVKTHVSHLFDKLAANNRVQLAIAAFRADLVE